MTNTHDKLDVVASPPVDDLSIPVEGQITTSLTQKDVDGLLNNLLYPKADEPQWALCAQLLRFAFDPIFRPDRIPTGRGFRAYQKALLARTGTETVNDVSVWGCVLPHIKQPIKYWHKEGLDLLHWLDGDRVESILRHLSTHLVQRALKFCRETDRAHDGFETEAIMRCLNAVRAAEQRFSSWRRAMAQDKYSVLGGGLTIEQLDIVLADIHPEMWMYHETNGHAPTYFHPLTAFYDNQAALWGPQPHEVDEHLFQGGSLAHRLAWLCELRATCGQRWKWLLYEGKCPIPCPRRAMLDIKTTEELLEDSEHNPEHPLHSMSRLDAEMYLYHTSYHINGCDEPGN